MHESLIDTRRPPQLYDAHAWLFNWPRRWRPGYDDLLFAFPHLPSPSLAFPRLPSLVQARASLEALRHTSGAQRTAADDLRRQLTAADDERQARANEN